MKRIFFFSILLFFSACVSIHQAYAQKTSVPEYMIIIADLEHPEFIGNSKIYISMNGESYTEQKIPKDETKGKHDYNALIRIIKNYNKVGWKIMTSNFSQEQNEEDYIFVMMKRDKPYKIKPVPVDTIFDKNMKKMP